MFQKIKEFLFGKPATVAAEPEAPYKVEAPAPAKCGCGRSQSGNCVGLHALSPEEWAVHADNPAKPTAKKAPAKKAATAKPAAAKKPRAKKTSAK